mgnify:CR=1 FL=1
MQEEEYKEVERKIREVQQKKEEEERLRKQKEEEERRKIAEKEEEERRKQQEKELLRQKKLESLPPEPAEGEENNFLIVIRLPDGNRVQRRFKNFDKAQVACYF